MTAAPVDAFISVVPNAPSSELSALVTLLLPTVFELLLALELGVENSAVVTADDAADELACAVNQLWSCWKNDVVGAKDDMKPDITRLQS
jgi:hypothetical protein